MSARVLIVDDNESLRRVFSALLTQAGYQVLAALPDGSKLVEWMRRETPDIVCLDYHLPGRDGLSLLADIDKAFPQVDVLFMTASGEASLEQRAADDGVAALTRVLDDADTRRCVECERAMNRQLHGSCNVPIAAYCIETENGLLLHGLVGDASTGRLLRAESHASDRSAGEMLGQRVAHMLLEQGAGEMLGN